MEGRLTQEHLSAAKVTVLGDLTQAHLEAIAHAIASEEASARVIELQEVFEAALTAHVIACAAQVGLLLIL